MEEKFIVENPKRLNAILDSSPHLYIKKMRAVCHRQEFKVAAHLVDIRDDKKRKNSNRVVQASNANYSVLFEKNKEQMEDWDTIAVRQETCYLFLVSHKSAVALPEEEPMVYDSKKIEEEAKVDPPKEPAGEEKKDEPKKDEPKKKRSRKSKKKEEPKEQAKDDPKEQIGEEKKEGDNKKEKSEDKAEDKGEGKGEDDKEDSNPQPEEKEKEKEPMF